MTTRFLNYQFKKAGARGQLKRYLRWLPALPLVLLLVSCSKPDPEQVRQNLFLPEDNYAADARRGKTIYHDTCVVCHGTRARGSRQGPPLVHSTYHPAHHHDLAFHLAVKNGVKQHHWQFGHMPPVTGVTPEQVSDIVAYVRDEQRKAGIK